MPDITRKPRLKIDYLLTEYIEVGQETCNVIIHASFPNISIFSAVFLPSRPSSFLSPVDPDLEVSLIQYVITDARKVSQLQYFT